MEINHVGPWSVGSLMEIMSGPGFAQTSAVMDVRVLYYDSSLLKQQGPREVLAIRKLAYLPHPEAFVILPEQSPGSWGAFKSNGNCCGVG